jgi:photosystem II stability/assembly factor-like uncharacterized protein
MHILYKKSGRLIMLPGLAFLMLSLVLAACGQATTNSSGATSSTTTPTNVVQIPTATPGSTPTTATTGSSSPSNEKTVPLTAIRMVDSNNGWALTASSILKTSNGGSTWQDVSPANAEINTAAQGDFLNGQIAWVAIPTAPQTGKSVLVWRTTDGGQNWQSAIINDLNSAAIDVPHFLNAQQGWLAVSGTPGAGNIGTDIWHSTDGGATWTQIQKTGSFLPYPAGISYENAQTAIVAGNVGAYAQTNSVPGVSVSHDGGKTWKIQFLNLPQGVSGANVSAVETTPPVFFGNVAFLPVFISMKNAADEQFVLYRSNNSGQTWFQTRPANINAISSAVYVLDTSHAWATDTTTGKLYNTIDGGTDWFPTANTPYNFIHLSFTDLNNGWGLTKTALYHTTDSGKTWQQVAYSIQH